MKLKIISVNNKVPKWVEEGFYDYAKRVSTEIKVETIEIKPETKTKNHSVLTTINKEGEKIIAKIKKDEYVVILDLNKKQITTEQLADKFSEWQLKNKKITFIIGGAHGLSEKCKSMADYTWCLSELTLPHPLVKIILMESIYRCWSIIKKHPYSK